MTLLDVNVLEADYSASTASIRVTEGQRAYQCYTLAKNNDEPPEGLKSPWGIMFDLGWDFKGAEGNTLTDWVLDRIAPNESKLGKRAESKHALIRKILANAFYAFNFHRPSLVAYYRKGDANCYKANNRPKYYNHKAVCQIIDAMEKAGLVENAKGVYGKGASTYKITQKLLIASMGTSVKEHNLDHILWQGRLLRVYETNRKGGKLVDFKRTRKALHWEALLSSFNAFTAQHSIALNLSDAEREQVIERFNKKRKKGLPEFYRPALIRTGLYRSFNYSSFVKGGRLYGGWWQNVPSALRGEIIIDERPTVELDYSCFHIRMLYNLLGLAYEDEAYYLEEIDLLEQRLGLPKDYYRESIKKITQALINSPKGVKGERCKLPEGISFHPHFSRAEVRQMIEKKHHLIAQFFSTGEGLKLQRMDSDLALQIITNLQKKGILALPVHDSFIVQQRYENELRNEMINCYRIKFIFDPIID